MSRCLVTMVRPARQVEVAMDASVLERHLFGTESAKVMVPTARKPAWLTVDRVVRVEPL